MSDEICDERPQNCGVSVAQLKVAIGQCQLRDGQCAADHHVPVCAPQQIRTILIGLPFENRDHVHKALQRIQRQDSPERTASGHCNGAYAAVARPDIVVVQCWLHDFRGVPADRLPGPQLAPIDKGAIQFGVLVDRTNETLLRPCGIARQQQREQLETLHLLAHSSDELGSGGSFGQAVINAM